MDNPSPARADLDCPGTAGVAKLHFCGVEVDKVDNVPCISRFFILANLVAVGLSWIAPAGEPCRRDAWILLR